MTGETIYLFLEGSAWIDRSRPSRAENLRWPPSLPGYCKPAPSHDILVNKAKPLPLKPARGLLNESGMAP